MQPPQQPLPIAGYHVLHPSSSSHVRSNDNGVCIPSYRKVSKWNLLHITTFFSFAFIFVINIISYVILFDNSWVNYFYLDIVVAIVGVVLVIFANSLSCIEYISRYRSYVTMPHLYRIFLAPLVFIANLIIFFVLLTVWLNIYAGNCCRTGESKPDEDDVAEFTRFQATFAITAALSPVNIAFYYMAFYAHMYPSFD